MKILDTYKVNNLVSNCIYPFISSPGDERANEQVSLTCMHTLWLREHNRIAKYLAKLTGITDDEELFQMTRHIVVAQMQAITFGEFLPIVLGPTTMSKHDLSLRPYSYTAYDYQVNPSILNEFSTAAYRFGHSLIHNKFPSMNKDFRKERKGEFQLKDMFQSPHIILNESSATIERFLRGLTDQASQKVDNFITRDIRDLLFEERDKNDRVLKFGFDLPALNIQRGRDHGIPPYFKMRRFCGLSVPRSFDDLYKTHSLYVVSKLRQAYK